jgi:hypothetical protein
MEFSRRQVFRRLFSTFLRVLSLLFSLSKTKETFKVLNEVFICDTMWQDTVKKFVQSLFQSDLISPELRSAFDGNMTYNMNFKISLLTLDDRQLMHSQNGDVARVGIVRENVNAALVAAKFAVDYFDSISIFMRRASAPYLVQN